MLKRFLIPMALLMFSSQGLANAICEGIDAPPLLPGSPLEAPDNTELCSYFDGQAVLVVNTASQCGFTRQFKQLEEVYQRYKAQGLRILGFPSDNFGGQEFADAEQTAKVCYRNFGVSFPVFEASDVKGPNANPLFQRLSDQAGEPRWNFHKYLVTASGVTAYRSSVSPQNSKLIERIEASLQAPQ